MRNKKKHALGIAVGLIAMIFAMWLPLRAKTMWLYLSGAVIPSGHQTEHYAHKPFRILSVTGQRWATWDELENASAYYALVVLPLVIPGSDASESRSDGFTHVDIQKWQAGKSPSPDGLIQERQLAVTYNSLWQTITVGSRTYRLAKGNMFVVRYDENWQSEVTQLEATIDYDAGYNEVRNAFKSALSEDKVVQEL